MTDTHAQLSRLLEVRRYREAGQLLERALASEPHDPELHCFAAQLALGEDDLVRARDHIVSALRADPNHRSARILRFVVCRIEKDYAEAERTITQLIREQPGNAALIALYAELMLTTLHLDKARALADEALRRAPDEPRARVVDVLLLTAAGDRAAAQAQLAELIRADPEGAEVARTLFQVLIEQGRHREALAVGRQLLRLDPDNRALVEALAELRAHTHWLAAPAYPFRRFGWAGSAAVWIGGIVAIRIAARAGAVWGVTVAGLYLGYVIYSWVYPPLLKRWLLRRGF